MNNERRIVHENLMLVLGTAKNVLYNCFRRINMANLLRERANRNYRRNDIIQPIFSETKETPVLVHT